MLLAHNYLVITQLAHQQRYMDKRRDKPGKTPSRPFTRPVHQSSVLSVRFTTSILSPALNSKSPSAYITLRSVNQQYKPHSHSSIILPEVQNHTKLPHTAQEVQPSASASTAVEAAAPSSPPPHSQQQPLQPPKQNKAAVQQ